jgi:epoxyqueuosine reductase
VWIETMSFSLSATIKLEARRLGFDFCKLIPIDQAPHADFFEGWLAAGRAGEMHYLARNTEKRRTPHLLAKPSTPELRSLIVLGVNYHQFDLPPAVRNDPARGVIAAYAWGDDYHEIIRPLLHGLDATIRVQSGRTTLGKALVDTGPVLERDWAQRAGLGFTGKNCCTIHPQAGSWLLLATLLVPEVLVYDAPPTPIRQVQTTAEAVLAGLLPDQNYGGWEIDLDATSSATGTCGRCTRCLTACPTDAFVGPYHLDPLRCISYWTIEARSPIPRALRSHFGNRIFGCDICQEVCPWNARLPEQTPLLAGLAAQQERVAPPLLEGFQAATPYWLNEAAFREQFRRSPILHTRRSGMVRNVCVALGNWGDPAVVDALALALHDPEPLARGHAAWALSEVYRHHRYEPAAQLLVAAQPGECDPWVQAEIGAALAQTATG